MIRIRFSGCFSVPKDAPSDQHSIGDTASIAATDFYQGAHMDIDATVSGGLRGQFGSREAAAC